ncbi:hypothetical protein [Sporosarcina aquimarina]|uniref:hypothetical protein n=1 Tax=Sporosarcina aquimarina TaxID=114975 RepID=UPI001C8E9449|nr:hypothetical protein [Sporosarcina aquimarina]MBY0221968.1 hypothetical protein [Sporosarcina aquimarina]
MRRFPNVSEVMEQHLLGFIDETKLREDFTDKEKEMQIAEYMLELTGEFDRVVTEFVSANYEDVLSKAVEYWKVDNPEKIEEIEHMIDIPEPMIDLVRDVVNGDENYIIDYWDMDRIYLKKEDTEYIIRTWDFIERKKDIEVRWTFFRMIEHEDGGGHGEELSSGNYYYELPKGEE